MQEAPQLYGEEDDKINDVDELIDYDQISEIIDKIVTCIRSELVQGFFNFVVFSSAMFVFTNNIFELNYKSQGFDFFEFNYYLLAVLYQTVCALVVMMQTIRTPFTMNQTFSPLTHCVALLVACQSYIVDDPQLLFTSTQDLIQVPLPGGGDYNYTLSVESSALKQDIGAGIISCIALGKFVLLITGIINVFEFQKELRLYSYNQIKCHIKTIVYDQWYNILLLILTCFSYGFRFLLTEEEIVSNLRTLVKQNASFLEFLESTGIETLYYFVANMFSLIAVIKYFFSRTQHGYLILFFTNLQNLVQYDTYLYDGPMFNFTYFLVALTFFASISTVSFKENQLDPQNVVYKVGHILSILSLLFLLVACTNDWFDIQSTNNLSANITLITDLELVDIQIDIIIDDVYDAAVKLQPCVRKNLGFDFDNAGTIEGTNSTLIYTDESVVEANREERFAILQDSNNYYNPCILNESPDYPVNVTYSTECAAFRDDQREGEIVNAAAREQSNPEFDDEFVNTPVEQDEYIVDDQCVSIQCTAVLTIALTASALSFVPFMGGVAWGIQMANRVAYQIYQIGRMIFKMIYPMKKRRRRLKRLAKRVAELVKTFAQFLKFGLQQLIILIPQFAAFSVSVALILYRRDKHVVNGQTVAIGVFGPLFASFFLTSIFIFLAPEIIVLLTGLLPEEFIDVTLYQLTGYQALKFSYLAGACGQLLLIISCQLAYLEQSDNITGTIVKTGASAKNKKNDPDWLEKEIENVIEPGLFSIPGLFFCIWGTFVKYYPYVKYSYRGNDEVGDLNTEATELEADEQRSGGMFIETDQGLCGIVGRAVLAVVDNIVEGTRDALDEFSRLVSKSVSEIQDLLTEIANLSFIDFQPIDIPEGYLISNIFVYIIPLCCSIFIITVSILNVLKPSTLKYNPKIAIFIVYVSFSNVIGHMILSSLLSIQDTFDFPYIETRLEMGPGFYITVGSSLGNIISAFIIYLNSIIPLN